MFITLKKTVLIPPFKCYIYCTQISHWNPSLPLNYENPNGNTYIAGKNYSTFFTAKVVGEFICDEIVIDRVGENADILCSQGLLTLDELKKYGKNKVLYGWHISELKMYSRPKELTRFRKACPKPNYCSNCGWRITENDKCGNPNLMLKRSPQGWCYVEKTS